MGLYLRCMEIFTEKIREFDGRSSFHLYIFIYYLYLYVGRYALQFSEKLRIMNFFMIRLEKDSRVDEVILHYYYYLTMREETLFLLNILYEFFFVLLYERMVMRRRHWIRWMAGWMNDNDGNDDEDDGWVLVMIRTIGRLIGCNFQCYVRS